jgi:hypothetical protein
MNMITAREVRERVYHSLSYEVAQSVGLTLHELQQVAAGNLVLEQPQLDALARHLNIAPKRRPPSLAQLHDLAVRMGYSAEDVR